MAGRGGAFVQFVWHLSLSVVAAREHLWLSCLRGVGGDSGVCGWRQCCGFVKHAFFECVFCAQDDHGNF